MFVGINLLYEGYFMVRNVYIGSLSCRLCVEVYSYGVYFHIYLGIYELYNCLFHVKVSFVQFFFIST